MEAYREDKGSYPPRATTDRAGVELLSWRVELLPYLGYGDLYQQFQTGQPWFSAANKKLAESIPSVYQSPERFDAKTNYLAVSGGSTVFAGKKAVLPGLIEDGPEHTVFIVEANDDAAVPWTQPQDYVFSRGDPIADLGDLRSGHIFVAWGGGQASAVATSGNRASLIAMFTSDAGESFSSYSIAIPLDDDLFAALDDRSPQITSEDAHLVDNAVVSSEGAAAALPRPSSRMANTLASEYNNAAVKAMSLGSVADAVKWRLSVQFLRGLDGRLSSVSQWVTGLRRPMATVHFGIGLREDRVRRRRNSASAGRRQGLTQHREEVLKAVGRPVGDILNLIEEHAATLMPPLLASAGGSTTKPASRQLPPPVTYLAPNTRSELLSSAREAACDVLVMIEIEHATGRNRAGRSFKIDFFDLAGARRLLDLPEVHWIDSPAGLGALRRQDTYRTAKFRVEDLLIDQLSFSDWPRSAKEERIAEFVSPPNELGVMNKLQALAELSTYRAEGIVSDRQVLQVLRGLLGNEEAEMLLLGQEDEKRRVLRTLLPDPELYAEQLPARNADDD